MVTGAAAINTGRSAGAHGLLLSGPRERITVPYEPTVVSDTLTLPDGTNRAYHALYSANEVMFSDASNVAAM